MPDDFDRSLEQQELILEAERNHRKPTGPAPTGWCLWCGEDVAEGKRWCDADCRDMDQKYNHR